LIAEDSKKLETKPLEGGSDATAAKKKEKKEEPG
jgi:hypothetical protein